MMVGADEVYSRRPLKSKAEQLADTSNEVELWYTGRKEVEIDIIDRASRGATLGCRERLKPFQSRQMDIFLIPEA
jgi:hypothetical protein